MMKQIIGREHESWGLSILDIAVSRPIETHCRLGHPSLLLLKKLCPQVSSL